MVKTDVMSPGARAAAETRRNAASNSSCSRVGLRFYRPEALGWWWGWGRDYRRTRQNPEVIGEMPAPETFPLQLLPATISAVKGNDSILIWFPFNP